MMLWIVRLLAVVFQIVPINAFERHATKADVLEDEDTTAEIIGLFVLIHMPPPTPFNRCVISELCKIQRQRPTRGVPLANLGPEGVQSSLAVVRIAPRRAPPLWIDLGRSIHIVGVHRDAVCELQEAMIHSSLEPLHARPPPQA